MKFHRPTPEQAMAQMIADIEESKRIIDALMDYDLLDEDGYPTDEALQIVEEWHWSDPKGWFEFINGIWHLKSWGWCEGMLADDYNEGELSYQYHISTAGWSGNENLIRSMQKNHMLWDLNWVQSRRGGHYIFELRDHGNQEEEDSRG